MKEKLWQFSVIKSVSMIEAIRKIDANKKGFLVVIDENEIVFGTVTDGDIRRSFMKGNTVNTIVSNICNTSFSALTESNSVSDAIEMFKNSKIKFLPVLDKNKKLINIITKRQLYSLLLQDIHVELDYDFQTLDENVIDYEVFQRPWGFFKTTVLNEYFQSKIISVNPRAQLSLQSHKHREEHWIVVHGVGLVQIGESMIEVKCGSSLFVPKGCKHRIINTDETESLIVTEVQIGDYLGEDDIVRYEDIYERV